MGNTLDKNVMCKPTFIFSLPFEKTHLYEFWKKNQNTLNLFEMLRHLADHFYAL